MAVDWIRPLSRALVLKDGTQLTTLYDAAELITRKFGNIRPSAAVEHAGSPSPCHRV